MTQLITSQADRTEILPPGEGGVYVTAATHPMRMDDRVQIEIPVGASLADMVAQVQPDPRWHSHTIVMLGGEPIDRALWSRIRPKPGTHVVIRTVAQGGGGEGGKNPLATVLSIALIVATVVVAPYLGSAIATGLGYAAAGTAASIATAAVGASINVLGGLLINAVAPPPQPRLGQASGTAGRDSPTYQIQGARNRAAHWRPVPLVLGRHRIVPPYAAQPYTEIVGNEQYLRLLFLVSYGDVDVSDIQIGDTPISRFEGVSTQVRGPGQRTSLFTNQVLGESVGVPLSKDPVKWVNRTTGIDADEISVDLTFPQGIFWISDTNPKRQQVKMQVEIQYKLTSSSTWLDAPGFPKIIGGTQTSALLRGYSWSVPTGQYDVRVRRLASKNSANSTVIEGQGLAQVVVDTLQWTILRTIRHSEPVSSEIRNITTRLAVRIRASEQLQRVVDTLSCLAEPEIPDWNGSSWVARKTSNPASIYRHLLQGPQSPKPLPDNRIDLDGLEAFHEHCTANGFRAEGVIESDSTIFEQLQAVCAAGRAAFGMRDGKFGVVIDREQTVPVQHFTPRNSWGFEAEKVFSERVHAFRARFADRDRGYRSDAERIVYADGYSAANAENYDEIELPLVTGADQVYALTRYYIASTELRPEQFRLNCDLAHLVCTRTDLVRVQHDVILVGLASGRIKSVDTDGNGNVTAITLDERVAMAAGTDYGVVIVSDQNVETTRKVTTVEGETATLTLPTPISADNAPEPGWLVIFGEHGTETIDAIVNRIEMLDDMQARLTLVDAAPAVLHAADGPIPEYDPGITLPPPAPEVARPQPPKLVSAEAGSAALAQTPTGLVARAIVTYAPASDGVTATACIVRYRLRNSGNDWSEVTGDGFRSVVLDDVQQGETYEFQARSVTQFGVTSFWSSLETLFILGKLEPPPDVPALLLERPYVVWEYPDRPADFAGFRVRFHAGVRRSWSDATPAHDGLITDTRFNVDAIGGGTRSILVKAVDTGGRESDHAAILIKNVGDALVDNILLTRAFRDEAYGVIADTASFWASDVALMWGGPNDPFWTTKNLFGGDLVNGELRAREQGVYWTGSDTQPFWSRDDNADMWTATYEAMTYLASFVPRPEKIGEALTIDLGIQADGYTLQYRTDTPLPAWQNDSADYWSNDGGPMWLPKPAYRAWPGKLDALSRQRYDFRVVTASGDIQGVIDKFTLTVDVPDLIEQFEDFEVGAGGSRLPITETYRKIKNVRLTLQDDGGAGHSVRIADKEAELGPLIQVLTESGALTSGSVDATIQGY